jgi:hypothetical protein
MDELRHEVKFELGLEKGKLNLPELNEKDNTVAKAPKVDDAKTRTKNDLYK